MVSPAFRSRCRLGVLPGCEAMCAAGYWQSWKHRGRGGRRVQRDWQNSAGLKLASWLAEAGDTPTLKNACDAGFPREYIYHKKIDCASW